MKVKEGFILRKFGKDYILTASLQKQVNFNKMISLNESGKLLWDYISSVAEFSVADMAKVLMDNYDGLQEEQALGDAQAFASSLIEAGVAQM